MSAREDNANKNAKHRFDALYKIWLERWFLVQTSDEEDDLVELKFEIREIQKLLAEDD